MKKYLVNVYLPASGQCFDALLPAGKRIDEAASLLVLLAGDLSAGGYRAASNAMLLDAESGLCFPNEMTVYDAGIRNASRLILI